MGVVSISNRAVLSESSRHAVLGGVGAVVTSEIGVLMTVVASGASSSSAGNGSTCTSLTVVRVCASQTGASVDTLGLVQLTLVEAGSVVAVTGGVLVVTVAGNASNVVVVVVSMALADGTEATSCAGANVLRDTLECIVALLTASKSSALGSELGHSHGRQSGGAVVSSLVVVNLVDRNGGVDNVGLDNLLLDHGLNGLVNVVVDVLTANGGSSALAVCGGIYAALILESSLLFNEVPLSAVVVTVIKLAVLNSAELGSVLLGENLAVMNRLNSAVVVVLVNLLVDGGLDLLVCVGLDDLVLNSRGNSLMDCGVVVSRLGHEVGDSCLGLVHFDVCWVV